jgi:hypothetical protein
MKMIQIPVFKFFNFKYAAFVWLILLLILPPEMGNQPFGRDERLNPVVQFELNDKLQADANALIPLFDNMPPVSVYLKDEPIIKTGSNTERGVAYTQCEQHDNPTIFIKKDFYRKANRQQLVNILKHELTHAWLCRQRLMSGHDERFRRKFAEVGGFGN